MSSCKAIVMYDYKFLTKMYKYLSKLFAKSVQRIHKPYPRLDFTNAQAFFVSACAQATSWKIKLVNYSDCKFNFL